MFDKLRIGKKFILSFGVMILLMAALTIVTLYSYSSVTHTTDDIVDGIAASKRANDIIDSASLMRRHFFLYLINRDPKAEHDFETELKKTIGVTNEIIEKTTFEENRKHAQAIVAVLEKTGKAENEFRKMDVQLEDAKNAYYSMADKVFEALEKIYNVVQKKITESEKKESGNTLVEENKVVLAESLLRSLILLEERRIARLKFIYAYNDDERRLATKNIHAVNQKFNSYTDQIKPNLPDGEASQSFQEVIPMFQKLDELGMNHSKVVQDQRKKQDEIIKSLEETIDVCQGMLKITAEDSQKSVDTQKNVVAFSRKLASVTAVAAVVIALLLGFALTRSVAGGISGIVNLFKRITKEGDTEVVINDKYLKRSDE
ncbi:MAG: hypothetical protein LBT05_02465, partial [Planctomycetaceae bacterium]|nr:hypothetical protein [Planctomycetaceae bacterium]